MTTATDVLDASPRDADGSSLAKGSLEALRRTIEHAAHYLPAQGPITVFIHHNTLHAFEDHPFDEGVQQGARLFGCQAYLPEHVYRDMLRSGRVRPADIEAALLDDLGERADALLGFMGTRFRFRQAMLHYPLQTAPPAELLWFIAETDALARFRLDAPEEARRRFIHETRHWVLRDHRNGGQRHFSGAQREQSLHEVLVELIDQFGRKSIDRWSDSTWERFALASLWRICEQGVSDVELPTCNLPLPVRHRDRLLAATGRDIDELVNEVLIRFCSAFLDQGLAHWPLPERERGLWVAFAALYRQVPAVPAQWLEGLAAELQRLAQACQSPLEIIHESLRLLGVELDDWEQYLIATLLALRGWAGMIQQVEIRGDSVAHSIPAGSLVEYLAVRLLLERLAIAHVAREELGFRGPLTELNSILERPLGQQPKPDVDRRAFQVFQLAQVLGWLPPALAQLMPQEWTMLVQEIEAFSAMRRRKVLHAAFERRYRHQTLDAISIHARPPAPVATKPRFQIICCLDEREESFRRHLEEICQEAETFGAAGFYSVPMYYRGVADAHFVPLCPIVVRPRHWVVESIDQHQGRMGTQRARARRALGMATHGMHLGSRSVAGGAVLAGMGALAAVPLVARVLFPRLTAQIRRWLERWVRPPVDTHLDLERSENQPAPQAGHLGFTVDEMTDMAERLLIDLGVGSRLAPLVLILGHGSQSLNNPHNSAYNCGACGGSSGGPNARAMAQMLNDPRVRQSLARRHLSIPEGVWFVGGWHNTCNDAVAYFDADHVPPSLTEEFERLRQIIDATCDWNAHERCRRFLSAPLTMTPAQARRHVEARSEDLAQTRPECGHATNAICVIGRRHRTRGLFLDRRAFLVSYDPTQDEDERVLTRLLGAALPVCGGINLEYYFSYVDNVGFGCGTKLPHNITSLLGVMDGAASDLRTGLPWQMVEIHEPVRLLFIIETTAEAMLRIMERNPEMGKLCTNGWVQLATLSPNSSQVHLLRGGHFEPYRPETSELPKSASSFDWYRGWREHLGFAVIGT